MHTAELMSASIDTAGTCQSRLAQEKNAQISQKPIRRLIENDDVPLPNKWMDFLASGDNKRDLSLFLANAFMAAPSEKTVVFSSGFTSETEVQNTDSSMNTELLEGNHGEADTRILLHCIRTDAQIVVVSARDHHHHQNSLGHLVSLECPYYVYILYSKDMNSSGPIWADDDDDDDDDVVTWKAFTPDLGSKSVETPFPLLNFKIHSSSRKMHILPPWDNHKYMSETPEKVKNVKIVSALPVAPPAFTTPDLFDISRFN
ncbi:hypothetical protein GQR58_028703 [Nymphon striatum]|nr:hypothetical protein GQR58_028703 [Nymphon striatum]